MKCTSVCVTFCMSVCVCVRLCVSVCVFLLVCQHMSLKSRAPLSAECHYNFNCHLHSLRDHPMTDRTTGQQETDHRTKITNHRSQLVTEKII